MKRSTDHARELYDTYRFGTFSHGRARERYEALLLELLASVPADARVFDVGCGTGFWLDAYQRAGIPKDRLTCIDLAPRNIEELTARGFRALVGDVLHLDGIHDGESDLTVCIGVIHHTDEPLRAFRELARITRPGGHIYLNVYNRFHPYYYVVHRAAFPLRYAYWNWSRKTADIAYWFARFFVQPLAYIALGKTLDDRTGRTLFMDQVMTPRAHLFTKARLESFARSCGCHIERFRYNRYGLMLSAVIRVNDPHGTSPSREGSERATDSREITGR